MAKLILNRFYQTEKGTLGMLDVHYADRNTTQFVCFTLENAWKDNEKRISCIPAGVYTLEKTLYRRKLPTVEVMDVPNRTYIKIRKGDTVDDTLGCPLLGTGYTISDNGYVTIQNSRVAYNRFKLLLDDIDCISIRRLI